VQEILWLKEMKTMKERIEEVEKENRRLHKRVKAVE